MISLKVDDLIDFSPKENPDDLKIVFSTGKNLLLKFLQWDNDFFGCPCYRVDFSDFSTVGIPDDEAKIFEKSLPGTYQTAVCDHSFEPGLPLFLQTAGFKFIEGGIILRYQESTKKEFSCPSGVEVRKVTDFSGLDLEPLGLTFDLTRFHADPNIGKQKADDLWVQYLKNFTLGEKKHAFLAFTEENLPVGGIFVNLYDDSQGISTADFFVVTVIKDYAGKGIGSFIAQEAIKWAVENSEQVIVGTQSRNVPALNYYLKNGFTSIYKTTSIFHRWS